MTVLVGYSSKYGSTQGIAERITRKLRELDTDARMLPAAAVPDPSEFSAFVIGGATYVGSWRSEASEFVRHNHDLLATRPVWLFSSGPLGTATTDAEGRELVETSEPKEFNEFEALIRPRAMRVFFGTMDPNKLNLGDRLMRKMPPLRAIMPEGDFRDWSAIDEWATGIAHDLALQPS